MTYREEKISSFLHSRESSVILTLYALFAGYVAFTGGYVTHFAVDKGLGLASPGLWYPDPMRSCILSMLVSLGIGGLMIFINARFNLLRDITILFAGLFMAIQAALPTTFCSFNGGTMLAVFVLGALLLLYTVYNKPSYTRFIFLAFFLIALGALMQYAFIAYIPVFLMGMGQMRAFNGRTFVAALLGIVTPLWICWSFGWVDYADWHGPDFASIMSVFSPEEGAHFLATVGFTVVLAFSICVLNLVKVFSYNSRTRSYNGFVALLLIATSLFMLIDFTNIPFYITLLNVTAAYQIAQFQVINIKRRAGYIVVLTAIIVYVGLFVWRILI